MDDRRARQEVMRGFSRGMFALMGFDHRAGDGMAQPRPIVFAEPQKSNAERLELRVCWTAWQPDSERRRGIGRKTGLIRDGSARTGCRVAVGGQGGYLASSELASCSSSRCGGL